MTEATQTAAAKPDAVEPDAGGPATARGRPNRWKVAFVALLVLGVLGTSAWVLFGSRVLVVRHIDVTGTHIVPQSRVLAAAGVRLGGPMIRLDTGAVADRVAGIQEVESVKVVRRWPATLQITVRERVPVVVYERDRRYAQIDRFGVVVRTSSAPPRGLPRLFVAAPGPSDPATAAAVAVWRSLPPRFTARLSAIAATGPEAVTLRLESGVSVVWGAPERAAEKLRLLDALLHGSSGRGARTIDVSSPEVVTTR